MPNSNENLSMLNHQQCLGPISLQSDNSRLIKEVGSLSKQQQCL